MFQRYAQFWFSRKGSGNSFSTPICEWFFQGKCFSFYILLTDQVSLSDYFYPVGIFLFKVNNGNTRTRWKICSKLTNCLLWTYFTSFSRVSIVNFEQVNADCVLREILGNMCILSVCWLGCDVINSEINFIFLIKPFFYVTKKSRQEFKYLENEKSF